MECGKEIIKTNHDDIRLTLDQIADKWSILILTSVCTQPQRFNAIKRQLDGITQKALTQCLRRLERNGLIRRHVITEAPIAVEYSATELGATLRGPFTALCSWAKEHKVELVSAQETFDRKSIAVSDIHSADHKIASWN